jgi:hypothetical protein
MQGNPQMFVPLIWDPFFQFIGPQPSYMPNIIPVAYPIQNNSIRTPTVQASPPSLTSSLAPISNSASSSVQETHISQQQKMKNISRLLQDHQLNPLKSNGQLARDHGFHRYQVGRILSGKANLTGQMGRPTHLTKEEEGHLAIELKRLVKSSRAKLQRPDVVKIAKAMVSSKAPTAKVENCKFTSGWFKGFNQRNPKDRLKAVSVRPVEARREACSTRENVLRALQGEKHHLMTMRCDTDPPGFIQSWRVFCLDETDISCNNEGGGVRNLAVGDVKPKHIAPGGVPHVTSIPILCLNGELLCNIFIIAGSPTVATNFNIHSKKLLKSITIFNKSGSVEMDGDDGEGSWSLAL